MKIMCGGTVCGREGLGLGAFTIWAVAALMAIIAARAKHAFLAEKNRIFSCKLSSASAFSDWFDHAERELHGDELATAGAVVGASCPSWSSSWDSG
jgi:hypothetical protein